MDFDSTFVGIDDRSGRFGEVRIEQCLHCERRWLVYFFEIEGISESGRWYRGEIGPDDGTPIAPTEALDVIGGLDSYFVGGSYFRSEGTLTSGEIRRP
ncbi:MAG: hypothetical protein ABFS86_13490 [Planctomycetota bacterium]